MSSQGSITRWLGRLQAGDHGAAQPLWEAYFRRLVALARAKLGEAPRRAADEEDVALSAFNSFWRGLERHRFPQLADRDDLWRLLVTITLRKAAHLARDERRQKRGGGAVVGESALGGQSGPGMDQFGADGPTPALAAQAADECRRLLGALGDEGLRDIALRKMEGDTNQEIADRLGCALSTVERRLALIRRIWERAVEVEKR